MRASRWLALAVVLAVGACSQARTPAPAREEAMTSTPPSTDCVAVLKQLSTGAVADLRGLPPGCTRALVAQALGASVSQVDALGAAGPFREYPPSASAPNGILVFYDDGRDEARYLRIDGPIWPVTAFGEPEAVAPSDLSAIVDQRVWASRGLALHVARTDGVVRRAYIFRPTTVVDYLASDLARVSVRREPIRR